MQFHDTLHLLRMLLLTLAIAPFGFYLLSIWSAVSFFGQRPQPHEEPFTPPVSILKPCRGLDPGAYENFTSFCRQDYPEFEILFCVTDETDPAIPVIEQIIRDFPDAGSPKRAIRLRIGAEPLGVSDKVNKLCRMVREARHDIVIVTDSDVRVGPGFLRAAVAPFRDPKIGGVTCLYRGLTDGSFAANLEALGNSTDFAPGVLVAWMLGGRKLNFMLGAVMATTKKHLAEIGGFESLVDYFCDDYELGNRLAARGRPVELIPFPVDIVYPRESLGEAFRHQIRWNLSIRYSRPWGHASLIFTQLLIWCLAGFILAKSFLGMFVFAAGYALLRGEVALSAGARGMKDNLVRPQIKWLWLRDLFAFAVWLASFLPQRIVWRGRKFLVREKRLVLPE